MARCSFCQRRFSSDQSVKAHLRFCLWYKRGEKKSLSALGTSPKAGTTTPTAAPVNHGAPMASPASSNPFSECFKSICQSASKPEEKQSPEQRQRILLQAIKEHVITRYQSSEGNVTTAMRGAAKIAIERELRTIPLEELSPEERYEVGAAIRDRIYDPIFEAQAQEASCRQEETQAKRRKDCEQIGAWRRASRRKETLIDQASAQAIAMCEAKQVGGWDRLSVLADIHSRLNELLTGEEPVTEAHAIIQWVLDARFAELDGKLAAAQAKRDAKWREEMLGLVVLCGPIALPVLAVKFPEQILPIISWIEQTFRKTASGTEATANASSQTTSTSADSSKRPRRRRKAPPTPSSPWGNPFAADRVAEHNVSTMAGAAPASV